MLYRRGRVWWFKFKFAKRVFQESSKSDSKEVARRAELKRRRDLEEGFHGLRKREAPQTLKTAAAAWLETKKPTLAPKSYVIERTNLGHLLPVLGQRLLNEIDAGDISRYQQSRTKENAAPKTVNLEVGTLRAILRRHRLWAGIQPDVRMLSVPDDIGKALSAADEKKLLDTCAESRSRSLLPAVLLALNTGMRYSELRLLRWQQVDFVRKTVRVGKSKTEAGTGRTIPLNDRASKILQFWADQFPKREPEHFVFPSERYGAAGDDFKPCVYDTQPTRAINSWKESWESAKKAARVTIRFHDLRHTCVTRMLEGGVPLSVVASILGWSSATTARMAKRYGHIGQIALRHAVSVLDEHVERPAAPLGDRKCALALLRGPVDTMGKRAWSSKIAVSPLPGRRRLTSISQSRRTRSCDGPEPNSSRTGWSDLRRRVGRDRLDPVPSRTGGALGISRCFFYVHDFAERKVDIRAEIGFDAENVRTYQEYYAAKNPTLIHGKDKLQPGNVCPTRALCPERILVNSEFYNDWAKPQNIGHGVTATVLKNPRLVGLFGLLQDIGDPEPTDEHIALLRTLMPHLGRAIKLHTRIVELEVGNATRRDALDRLPQGIFLLDTIGRVIWMNRAAERLVRTGDGLTVRGTHLYASRTTETAALRALIRGSLSGSVSGPHTHGVLSISRLSSDTPLVLSVDRMSLGHSLFADPRAACAIFASSSDNGLTGNETLLQKLYQLTPAESRVAMLLAQGKDSREISSKLGVRPDTVRVHLKKIFQKTNTNRQAQLLHLLLSGPLSLPNR